MPLKSDYNELAANLSNYVVKLLDKVQGNEELNVILHNPDGLDMASPNKTLARLQLAIQYKEKRVITILNYKMITNTRVVSAPVLA